jgi:SAM-dependent methyltransferase
MPILYDARRAARLPPPAPPAPAALPLPQLLAARGLAGAGAVVGMPDPAFCAALLSTWRGARLVAVCAWGGELPDAHPEVAAALGAVHENLNALSLGQLAQFGARSERWRLPHGAAAARVAPASLDFVYLDRAPDAATAVSALAAWLPAVRPGGVVAGRLASGAASAPVLDALRVALAERGLALRESAFESAWASWTAVLAGAGAPAAAPPAPTLPHERVFAEIHRHNAWGSDESRSGTGSTLAQTRAVRAALPALLRRLGATSMLDLPCGDFNWMAHVPLDGVRYVGADVVPELVARNAARFAAPGRSFAALDLCASDLPAVDVVFCRDCLVHLSYDAIRAAIRNLKRSGSRYLLTTTFTGPRENRDIATGDWRPLALTAAPFHFPPPLALLDEECTEDGGIWPDKSLGLWALGDIPEVRP